MALAIATTNRNDVRTMINDFDTWDQAYWENFNTEMEYCEKHIILPDIPEDQVKQKAIEIIKSEGLTRENVTKENAYILKLTRDSIERDLIHWIGQQIDKVNSELMRDYNEYDGYMHMSAQCTCNYNFMLDTEFDFVRFVKENL